MDKDSIDLFDITRILQGEVPIVFYIELVIRALVVYFILIAGFRLMGKRMSSRMTRNVLAAVATLAAAVGIPLQTPDRGLLPGVVIAAIVVLVQRLVSGIGSRNERFERSTQGKISTLVEMGQLKLGGMRETRISRERVFSQLRNNQIRHLGEVERLYLEASGSFTLVKRPKALPGLCVLPEWDVDFISEQRVDQEHTVCGYCGHAGAGSWGHEPGRQEDWFVRTRTKAQAEQPCPRCDHDSWVKAIH